MSLYLAFEISNEDKKKLENKQIYLKQNAYGDFSDPTTFHITLIFLSEHKNQSYLAIKALDLFKEKYNIKPFYVNACNFNRFEQGVEWIGINDFFPLIQIKKKMEECLKSVQFNLKKDNYPNYVPHITMGYNIEEYPSLNRQFEEIPILIDNISLWSSIKCNGQHIHNKIYGINFK